MLPKIQKSFVPSNVFVQISNTPIVAHLFASSVFALMLLFPIVPLAQSDSPGLAIDVLNYNITIEVNDTSNRIFGKEVITFRVKGLNDKLWFDLQEVKTSGKGMKVNSVTLNGEVQQVKHKDDKLLLTGLHLDTAVIYQLDLAYSGIPTDGLVIGENMFGKRTYFGDNWPKRAHYWYACTDHPSDKATVSFTIHAPEKYDVIANGTLTNVEPTRGGMKEWSYVTDYVLPTKVMVVGIADFSIMELESTNGIPQSGWAYPEKEQQAFRDFKLAPSILDFYIQYFGEYPFDKLAHVQSTTRYGGMENASCIFYDESAIDGTGECEDLLAHEMVHQWFGNTVTECDWPHVWLSEGFATYFTNVYIQQTKGQEAFLDQMRKDRQRVRSFSTYKHALVDTNYRQLTDLLNANSYQKGGWILHMLRTELGDETFQSCIRSFYQNYKFLNACTDDFLKVLEEVNGKSFRHFFEQWVYREGHPVIHVDWKVKGKTLGLSVTQKTSLFNFPLEIQVRYKTGKDEIIRVNVDELNEYFDLPVMGKVKSIELDPNVQLLFDLF